MLLIYHYDRMVLRHPYSVMEHCPPRNKVGRIMISNAICVDLSSFCICMT